MGTYPDVEAEGVSEVRPCEDRDARDTDSRGFVGTYLLDVILTLSLLLCDDRRVFDDLYGAGVWSLSVVLGSLGRLMLGGTILSELESDRGYVQSLGLSLADSV